MSKKVAVAIILIAAIIIVLALVLLLTRPKPAVFSDDPKDWVVSEGRNRTVDVVIATKGDSHMDANGQQYDTATIGTVFASQGWYRGVQFRNSYAQNGKTLMRVGPSMIPNDGVLDGFIMEKLGQDGPKLYVFLDEDWKKSFPRAAVYWGKNYQFDTPFDFTKSVADGIYLNIVPDDPERFENNYAIHLGGAWAGDLRDDETSTLVALT
ncbi:MAG: hypothetical protein QXF14_04020 [Candidatus Woesearchaeota archaeon]